jgi:hypothetical protein
LEEGWRKNNIVIFGLEERRNKGYANAERGC